MSTNLGAVQSPAFAGLFIFAPKLKFKSEIHTKSAQN
jgi:hypothetical protein